MGGFYGPRPRRPGRAGAAKAKLCWWLPAPSQHWHSQSTDEKSMTSDSTMTIEEIQAAKSKLQSTISELLSQFSSETGTVVSDVDIEQVHLYCAPTLYVVQLEVKL
jgi:hypothetical protein